ncbi:MAG TPA: DUF4190 domain-containing protein [Thermoflexales bacterium]|nr:DUF4190 domain-containing protein [Thermoflexales bacterium]HQW34524.1 DUF4190 domain-containing protein [Thermoflexales bacterium]HQX75235.1 DUF4190 domain-containing protein [Thermoflexales bacterium]HQZ23592.1 DUF4190 domain-containing protein [Thermoflexales bacterium]HRA00956.1 DUF4190 domain-containing protein [Thermoflexales bacterium]
MNDTPINQTPDWNKDIQPIDPLEPITPQTVEDSAREAAANVVDDMNSAIEDTSKTLQDNVRETERVAGADQPLLLPAPEPLASSAPVFVPKTNTLAIISLISGLVSWVLFPVIGSIIGLVTGFMGRSEIKKSNGAETGDGLAVAGIIISGLNLLLGVLCVCGFFAMLMFGIMLPGLGN